jgi:hypothetical protein
MKRSSPLPYVQQVADVEEHLLAMQAKLAQWLGSRATSEAVELLPEDPKGVSEIATPAQYLLKDIVQIAQFGAVAHRNRAGNHWARSTARRINRLKGIVADIFQAYDTRLPRLLDALLSQAGNRDISR